MPNPFLKIGFSVAVLTSAAFAGGVYLGSANKPVPSTPPLSAATPSTTDPMEETSEAKTMFLPEEVAELNLKPSNLPPHYFYVEEKSGLTYDPMVYTGGKFEGAQWLKQRGWQAAHEAYFETAERPGVPVNSIHATVSVYEDVGRLNCIFQELGASFTSQGGKYFETSRTFGDASFLFLLSMEEPGVGRFPALQLRYYYGNVFVNLEVAGAEGTISQQNLEQLGTLIEQRLKEACPNCNRSPACSV